MFFLQILEILVKDNFLANLIIFFCLFLFANDHRLFFCNLLAPTNFIILFFVTDKLFANCCSRVRVVGVIKWSGWSGWSGWLGGLDDMHSENICFSWSKTSNY